MTEICPMCKGSGMVLGDKDCVGCQGSVKCIRCDGTGKKGWFRKCDMCGGNGVCVVCNGTGERKAECSVCKCAGEIP